MRIEVDNDRLERALRWNLIRGLLAGALLTAALFRAFGMW